MQKLRYGIIGIGKQGSKYCYILTKGLVKNGELVAVCDIAEDRKKWAEEKLCPQGIKFFDDYKELIDSGMCDAVLVETPHYDHAVIATYAISKGVHTLIDKPAGVYTKAIRELNEFAATKPEVCFGIMYNQRTNPLYKYAKELIDSNRLGELKRINWIITDWYRPQAYYDQGGWRGTWGGEGGGVLINQCPHQLDLFQWLGGMPKSIRGYAQEGKNRNIAVENDVTAYMEYDNGATGIFITSTHDFPGTNRLEIDGDKGKIVIEGNKLEFTELEVGEKEFNATNKKFMPKIPSKKIVKKMSKFREAYMHLFEQHTGIIRNFTNHVLNGDKLIAPGYEGIRGLTISNAIHLSSWLGKAVELPIDEEAYIAELNKRIEKENNK